MKFVFVLISIVKLQFCVPIFAVQPSGNNAAFKRGTVNPIAAFEELTTCTTYVDKTMLMAEFFKTSAIREYHLITCPHKFGKTINMDMFQRFVKNDIKGEIFRKFEIGKIDFSKNNFTKQCTVIHISFSVTGAKTYEEIVHKLSNNFKSFQPLVDLVNEISNKGSSSNEGSNCKSIMLDSAKKTFYPNPKTFLFVDDYDSPIINAIEYNIGLTRIMELMETIFFTLFNTRDHRNIHYALITGTMNVLDHNKFDFLKHWSFLDDHHFVEYFGFTENEVDTMLDDHGVKAMDKETVKEFYKAYNASFMSTRIYDPVSIPHYLASRNPIKVRQGLKNYWVENTPLIFNFLQAFKKHEKLQELLKNVLKSKNFKFALKKSWDFKDLVELKIMTHKNITELSSHRVDLCLSYLFHHGYFSYSDKENVYHVLYEDKLETLINQVQSETVVLEESDVLKNLFSG